MIDAVYRAESRRVLATLTRLLGISSSQVRRCTKPWPRRSSTAPASRLGGEVGRTVTGLLLDRGLPRNERLENTMMVRADIDRTWQIDGCRVSLMTEGVHPYSPVLMLIGI